MRGDEPSRSSAGSCRHYTHGLSRPNPFLLITIGFWGFNFVSLKLIDTAKVSPPALLVFRFALQWVLLVIIVKAMGGSLSIPREHRARTLIAGALTMGLYMAFFLVGTPRTAPAEAAIVLATMPIFTWLFSIVVGQDRFAWLRLFGSIVAFGGVALVVLGGSHLSPAEIKAHLLGDLIVFVGGLFWSAGIVIGRPVLRDVQPMRFFALSMVGAAPIVLLYGGLATLQTDWASVDTRSWINMTQLVVGSGVIATAAYYRGISDLGAAGATAYQFFVPPIAAGFAWLMLGQAMQWLQYVGIAVVVIGLMLPLWLGKKVPLEAPAIEPAA